MMKKAGMKTHKAFYRGYDGIPRHKARVIPADASDADFGVAISTKYS